MLCEQGICLSCFGDPGIGSWVREDKLTGKFRGELIEAAYEALVRQGLLNQVDWITAVPSLRSRSVTSFAERLAKRLELPFLDTVSKIRETTPQKEQRNSFHQAGNLDGAFEVADVLNGSVLLVDDMVDSKWTFTIIGALLRRKGAEAVIPFALASTTGGGDDE